MAIKLYEHQLDALKRMRNGCILSGGVGSGKSITALAFYYLCEDGARDSLCGGEYFPMGDPPKDLYIITTARKRDTNEWEKELAPFLLSTDSAANLYSNTVTVDSWNNIKKYAGIKGGYFIFDEQRVVGNGTWVKSFLQIAKENEWILLSATPGDTWTDYIPVFIANGYYRNRTEFINRHVVYSRASKFPKIDRFLDTTRLMRLRDRVLVKMDYDKNTVLNNEDILCGYDAETYKRVTKTRKNPWTGAPIMNAGELCYIWRRITNGDASRITAVKEIARKKKRVIIFYNFDYELELLREADFGEDVEKAEWNGHKHQPVPEGESWVYLVQYTAGAEGWNCVRTDTIIFYSQNYSYKVMVQAAGRTDRLNTPYHELYYYHLKSGAWIDVAISRALKEKKNFNETKFVKW